MGSLNLGRLKRRRPKIGHFLQQILHQTRIPRVVSISSRYRSLIICPAATLLAVDHSIESGELIFSASAFDHSSTVRGALKDFDLVHETIVT